MSDYYRDFKTIKDFILDDSFVSTAKKNDRKEITRLFSLYPDKKDMMADAIAVLQYIKTHIPDVPDTQIDEDWEIILKRIARKNYLKRRRRYYLWSAACSASACAALLSAIFLTPHQGNIREDLFELLESAEIQNGEVRIVTGKEEAKLGNDQTIVQTQEGSVLADEELKLDSKNIKTEYLTVVVSKGRRATLKLIDGTVIWINSETKLTYPKVFDTANREIVLDGEIYMDVAKDENRPFRIHTRAFSVEVTGTRLNISAYGKDDENSVVLVEGAVDVTAGDSNGTLHPGQGFFIENGSATIENVDVYHYICWKDRIMQLRGESLKTILKRLSRYYGLEIRGDERFALEMYEGKIDLSEPVETVLDNLSVSTPLVYVRNGDEIDVK